MSCALFEGADVRTVSDLTRPAGILLCITLLVATVGVMSLLTPHRTSEWHSGLAVALASVAADTDRRTGPGKPRGCISEGEEQRCR